MRFDLYRAIMAYAQAYFTVVAFTIFDILIVENLFNPIGFENISIYHYSYFGVFVPLLIIGLTIFYYLSRFRGGKIRYHKGALLDALTFCLTTFLLVYFGMLDFLYYVLRGVDIPSTLPWINEAYLGILLSAIRGVGDVTRQELLISVAVANVISAFIVWFTSVKGDLNKLP